MGELKNQALPAFVWRFPERKEASPHRVGGTGGGGATGCSHVVSHFERHVPLLWMCGKSRFTVQWACTVLSVLTRFFLHYNIIGLWK